MTQRYGGVAISLHWLVGAGLVGLFCFGLYMVDLPLSPTKLKYYSWHKWAGVTLFLLVLLRLTWRLTHAAPPLPAGMPGWQKAAASAAHWVLYALMLAIPLSGWLMSSAKGIPTVWFGVLPLPDLVAKDVALGDALQLVHKILNYSLAGVVVLHAAAALKHHFVDKDDVLVRMLPAAGGKRE
ncbi:MAG: cytochrome b [Rhodocyclaceae bacterium]